MTGLYIHVPFCAGKCPYCDFFSQAYGKAAADSYTDAVVRNIRALGEKNITADTVYFGGGTPSLLTGEQVARILHAAKQTLCPSLAEVTLEANPSTVTDEKLDKWLTAGVDRLSLGVQSANQSELESLGRLHTFPKAQQTVEKAVKAGFTNISCDVMIGTPHQTLESLKATVNAVASLPIQHISAYLLKIEQGTPFDNPSVRSAAADDDLCGEMYLQTVSMLEKRGFAQYEISNFAKSGFEAKHNIKYWTGESYVGIGPAAYSFFEGKRSHCPKDLKAFVQSPVQPVIVDETDPDPMQEYVLLGLRMSKGISLERLAKTGVNTAPVRHKAQLFEKAGLCILNEDTLALTPKGFLVSNSIIAEFITLL